MITGVPKLSTPRGFWTFAELARDPFDLLARAGNEDWLILSGVRSEEIVSALLCMEGRVQTIFLGDVEMPRAYAWTGGTSWVFLTSGTTGEPRQIPKTLKSISRPLSQNATPFGTWSFLTDITRMAGIQVAIEALGREEDLSIPDPGMTVLEKLSFMQQHNVTRISATPSQYRQLLGHQEFSDLELSQVTLGGEPADQKLLNSLQVKFPSSRLTHVYATTETGPIMAVSDGKSGFPADQLTKPGNRINISPAGEIGVTIDTDVDIHWTGDIVELIGVRYQFVGRSTDFINVGGAKVSPMSVERVIMGHSNVKDCLVKPRASAMLGQLVAADIVVLRKDNLIVSELRALCRKHLPRFAVPRFFNIVDELPQSKSGKKVRREI